MGRVACVFSCGRRSPPLLQAETALPVLPLLLILLLGGLLRSDARGREVCQWATRITLKQWLRSLPILLPSPYSACTITK